MIIVAFTFPLGPRNPFSPVPATQSTCHQALKSCQGHKICGQFLGEIKRACDPNTCNRKGCMMAVRDMYNSVDSGQGLEIAFCVCRNNPAPDQTCLAAQRLLHPNCASKPGAAPPSCHTVARSCKRNPDCRPRMDYYVSACAVDATSAKCAGPEAKCRDAMLGILGTELRTKCACEGEAADFRQLYDCYGWQRLLWSNPCVMSTYRNFNLKDTGGRDSTPSLPDTPSVYYPPPPPPTPPSIFVPPPPPPPPQPMPEPETEKPFIFRWTTAATVPFNGDLTPMAPTMPQTYPTAPWPKFRATTRTTVITTTTTVTTTLPPSEIS